MGALARVGGRNPWIAAPAGLLCAAIVAALVWVALPAVPTVVEWTGDTLRAATAPRATPTPRPSPAERVSAGEPLDCRDLYPDRLWGEVVWSGRVLLSQSTSPPPTTPALVEQLAPTVLVTCAWRHDSGATISTTLAMLGEDAAAEAAFAAQGFVCDGDGDGQRLHCVPNIPGVSEDHTVRGGLWLVSTLGEWHPEDYVARLEAYVWGEE